MALVDRRRLIFSPEDGTIVTEKRAFEFQSVISFGMGYFAHFVCFKPQIELKLLQTDVCNSNPPYQEAPKYLQSLSVKLHPFIYPKSVSSLLKRPFDASKIQNKTTSSFPLFPFASLFFG